MSQLDNNLSDNKQSIPATEESETRKPTEEVHPGNLLLNMNEVSSEALKNAINPLESRTSKPARNLTDSPAAGESNEETQPE